MIAVSEYLLKVLLCSAVFTGYYWLALRNKLFHHWNRFYLLGAVVLSICIPFVKFTVLQKTEEPTTAYQVLQSITTEEKWFEEDTIIITPHQAFFTKETIAITIYGLVSVCMLLLMVLALVKIIRILRQNPHWKLNGLTFVDTEAKGTPFSFLHYIFWNRKIDFESVQGQQIFSHELIHVQEKHTWDKLFVNFVLVLFWINPFFWLMKKELTMIHEFIADKKAVANGDTSAFAAMILAAAFPGQTLPLTNPFFYSPIKRRLLMLSKLNNPRMGYFSRLLLLPLLTVLFFAFVIKTKEHSVPYFNTTLDKEYVVVIDAGHGMQNGTVNGGKAADGYSEDEFAFALAKKVEELNTNSKLKILLSRKDENWVSLKERIAFAQTVKADLFISLHGSIAMKIKKGTIYIDNPTKGVEVYVPKMNTTLNEQNILLGNSLLNEMAKVIAPNRGVKTREKGIWVLEQSTYPAVLLECGFLSNKEDLKIMKDEAKREDMARAILRGIENYIITKNKEATIETVDLSQQKSNLFSPQNRKDTLPIKEKSNEALFTETETDAAYPGGSKAFNDYCFSYLKKYYSTLSNDEKSRNNSCQVRFIVEKNGSISNIEVITNTNSKLAEYCVSLLKQSGAWQPALQNGIPVRKLVTRNISFFDEHLKASYDERNAKKEKNEGEKDYSYFNKYELYLIDGKEVTQEDIKNYLATKEKNGEPISINAYDGNSGKIRYGDKGKNGVLEITTANGKPTVAISTEKLNILYADVENPLKIAVSDVPDQQLKVSISQGSIEKKGELYVAENLKPGEAVITVTYTYKSGKVITDQIRYKVISTSESISYKPVPSIAGSKGGRIDVAKFKTAGKIDVFSIADEDAIISSYTVYFTGKGFEGKPELVSNVKGNQFSKQVITLIEKATAGSTIVFDEIKVQTKKGEMKAPPIVFNLN